MAKTPNDSAPESGAPESTETDGVTKPLPRASRSAAPQQPAPKVQATPRAQATPKVLPTEQVENLPRPVSATAAASGGATGLPNASTPKPATPRENLTIFRRHPLASGIVAGIIAVVVVSSLTAWGVGSAVTASLTNQSAPVTPLSTATPTPQAGGEQGGRLAGGRLAFRATIQSIDGSTWTILTRRGQTVSVTITGSTQFGTKKASETQSSFSVGDGVVIVATKVSGTATAVRVVSAQDAGLGAGGSGAGTNGDQSTPTPSPTSTATT